MVGACLGARDGLEAIPAAWVAKTKKAREVISLMKKLFLQCAHRNFNTNFNSSNINVVYYMYISVRVARCLLNKLLYCELRCTDLKH